MQFFFSYIYCIDSRNYLHFPIGILIGEVEKYPLLFNFPCEKPNSTRILNQTIQIGIADVVQSTLDLRNSIFSFLNRELFDLRKIYVLILKTGYPKKMPYLGEFAS